MQEGFVTCIALRLDPNGICILSSAGHPAPYANGRELNMPGSLPLGLIPNSSYEETQFWLRVGDRFEIYTDGLLEARNPSGELYGFDRLQALFNSGVDAAGATEAAVEFGQDDDITVLTLVRLATGQESTTTLTIPMLTRTVA
jgi:serine phosphatase RsbU (regulator of sigma subunit)